MNLTNFGKELDEKRSAPLHTPHTATMGNTHITTSGVAGESLSEESVRRAAKLIVRADYGQYTLKDAKRLYQLCGDVVLTQETWYDESRARCGVASRRHSHVARTRAGVYGVVRSCLHSYILHLTTAVALVDECVACVRVRTSIVVGPRSCKTERRVLSMRALSLRSCIAKATTATTQTQLVCSPPSRRPLVLPNRCLHVARLHCP